MIDIDRFIYKGKPLSTPFTLLSTDLKTPAPEQRRREIAEQMAHQDRLWAIGVLRNAGFLPRDDSMTP